MFVTIKFLGVLSLKFGSTPIAVEIVPNYESLHTKIKELIGEKDTTRYVVLKNGKPLIDLSDVIRDGDTFFVFFPISGG